MSLVGELKRRNVLKAGGAYLVAGWLVIQVASTVAPQLALPEWLPRLVTLLVLLGFPIVLVVAWLFERTPEGLRLTPGDLGARRFFALVAVIVVASVVWLVLSFSRGGDDVPVAAGSGPSIAVLPFLNMSDDPANEYFADGISEELLNILAGIDGLRVASRTSAFSFRGKGVALPEIARALGVGHVLEGSVRRQGNRVRITAQLIEAGSDAHLWSQTYDRDLVDIFAVQQEIAQAIAKQLEGELGVRRVEVDASTRDLDAYDAFLRGRVAFHRRGPAMASAIADLKDAVRRDPSFADAWAYLAATANVAPGYRALSWDERETLAFDAAGRALELAPGHPLALTVRAHMLIELGQNLEGLEMMREAAERSTHESTPLMWYGINLMNHGYIEQARVAFERAYQRDPLVGINAGYLGTAYLMEGRLDLARPRLDEALSLGWGDGELWHAIALASSGDRAGATMHARSYFAVDAVRSPAELAAIEATFAALADPARLPEFDRAMAAARAEGTEMVQVLLAMLLGDADRTYREIEPILDEPWKLTVLEAWLPGLDWFRGDPRFLPMVERLGLRAVWAAQGLPPGCRIDTEGGIERLECVRVLSSM